MAAYKKHIEDKCRQCAYDPQDRGTWREQVERCSTKSCALWVVRPVSGELQRQRRAESLILDNILDSLPDEETA